MVVTIRGVSMLYQVVLCFVYLFIFVNLEYCYLIGKQRKVGDTLIPIYLYKQLRLEQET
jgi:hypothetical protein